MSHVFTLIFRFIKSNYIILLVILYGFLPLFWLKDNYIFRSEEVSYLDYSYVFDKYQFLWSSHTNNGQAGNFYTTLMNFPVGVYYKLLVTFGVPLYLIQRLFLVSLFQFINLSIFMLSKYLTGKSSIGIIVVLFYSLNFYSLSTLIYTAKLFQLFLMPLFFYFLAKYLDTGKTRYIFLNTVTFFVFQSFFTNLPTALLTVSVYIFVLILRFPRFDLKRLILFFIPTAIVLSNAILFYLVTLSASLSRANQAVFSSSFIKGNLFDSLQLFRGAWWERTIEYNRWLSFYDNPLIVFISFVIMTMIFVGVTRSRSRKYILWLTFFVFFTLLISGSGGPFGSIFSWFYYNFPGGFIFREPWAKFAPMAIFSGSIALSYSLDAFYSYRKKLYPVTVILILIHGYPFFTDRVLPHDVSGPGNIDILIPKYWDDLKEWSKNNKDKEVLVLPTYKENKIQHYHDWYPSGKGNFTGYLPELYLGFNSITNFNESFPAHVAILGNYNPKSLALLGIDYVLDQRDIQKNDADSTVAVGDLIRDGIVERLPRSFGLLDLYNVVEKRALPIFYSPDGVISLYGNLTGINDALSVSEKFERPLLIKDSRNKDSNISVVSGVSVYPLPKIVPSDPRLLKLISAVEYDPALGQIDDFIKSGNYLSALEILKRTPIRNRGGLFWNRLNSVFSDRTVYDKHASSFFIDCPGYCFSLEIPEDGFYKVAIPSDSLRDISTLKIENEDGNSQFWIKQMPIKEGLVSIGEINLKRGVRLLSVRNPNSSNLLDYKSGWKTPKVRAVGEKGWGLIFNEGNKIYPGAQDFPSEKAKYLKVNEWKPNTMYKIMVRYKDQSAKFTVSLGENFGSPDNTSILVDTVEGYKTENGNYYELFVKSSPNVTGAALVLASLGDRPFSEILIDELSITPVEIERMLVYKSNVNNVQNPLTIEHKYIDPTKYELRVSNLTENYSDIVFLQGYNNWWEIRDLDSGKSLDPSSHYIANGYANGWRISNRETGGRSEARFIVFFWPQKVYFWLLLLTISTLLVLLVFTFIESWRAKRRNTTNNN